MNKEHILSLYDELYDLFELHTTWNWKNGWQHEGDRLSKELTIQKEIMWHNSFLLEYGDGQLDLKGPNNFDLGVCLQTNNSIRVDILTQYQNRTFYYIDSESTWQANKSFIVDLCRDIYEATVKTRNSLSKVPKIHGDKNPNFALDYYRNNQLEKLI